MCWVVWHFYTLCTQVNLTFDFSLYKVNQFAPISFRVVNHWRNTRHTLDPLSQWNECSSLRSRLEELLKGNVAWENIRSIWDFTLSHHYATSFAPDIKTSFQTMMGFFILRPSEQHWSSHVSCSWWFVKPQTPLIVDKGAT